MLPLVWLQAQREKLDLVAKELEATVLTVPFDTDENGDLADGDEAKISKGENEIFAYGVDEASDEDDGSDSDSDGDDKEKTNTGHPGVPNALEKHKNIVKRFVSFQDLEDMPSPLCIMGLDLFIEWTYTVDLDRELFSVNMKTHFKLNNIPRDKWIDGVIARSGDVEDNIERTIRTCPEATRRLPLPAYFNNDEEVKDYGAKYASYKSSFVNVKRELASASPPPTEMLALETFKKFISPFATQLLTYIPGWNHEDFAFREIAFAILCFAAGEYHFETPNRLVGNADIGYLHYKKTNDTTAQGGSKFLPVFPVGSHHPGEEPGSAPSTGIFWFHSVLVSLVPDHIFQDESLAEAAVAKVVEFGLAEGKTNFNALVFSTISAIMVEVSADATKPKSVIVKRTVPTSIVVIKERRRRRNRSTEPVDPEPFKGFLSLVAFFDAAAHQDLSRYGQGKLPTEIFAKILTEVPDFHTNANLSGASKTFHELGNKSRFFGKDLTVTKCATPQDGDMSFTFKDRKNGQLFASTAKRGEGIEVWHPIIGLDKPSIIRQISFGLKAMEP